MYPGVLLFLLVGLSSSYSSSVVEIFLGSSKCSGGNCLFVLGEDEEGPPISLQGQHTFSRWQRPSDLPNLLELQMISGSSPAQAPVFDLKTTVFFWPRVSTMLEFLSSHGDSWKSEHYVFASDSISTEDFRTVLESEEIPMRLDSKVFFIFKSQAGGFETHETYGQTNKTTRVDHVVQFACSWPNPHAPCDPLFGMWNRRSNMSGIHLIAIHPKRMSLPNAAMTKDKEITGYFPQLFYRLSETLNFNYDIVQSVDGSYGRRQRNGSFTGMVGMLQRCEADISFSSQTLRFDRMQVNDYAPVLLTTKLGVFFKSSNAYQLNMWEMLAIYERKAWILFLCLVLGLVASLSLVYAATNPDVPHHSSIVHATANVTRSLILKGYTSVVKSSISSKLLCLSVGCLSLVMFAYLRSGLLSKLAVRTRNLRMHSVRDLLDSDLRVMVPPGGNTFAFFANSPRDTLPGQLWEKNIEPYKETTLRSGGVASSFDYVVRHGDHAHVVMETAGKLSPLYPCDVTELDEVLAKVQNSFAMQKDSPLSGILGHFVLQMVAAGVAKKTWDRFYHVKEDDCLADLDSSLDYSTLFGLFLILVAGVASAILMLSLELAVGAIMRGRRRSRNRGDIFRLKSVSHGEGVLMTELERLRRKVEEQEEMIRLLRGESPTSAVSSKASSSATEMTKNLSPEVEDEEQGQERNESDLRLENADDDDDDEGNKIASNEGDAIPR